MVLRLPSNADMAAASVSASKSCPSSSFPCCSSSFETLPAMLLLHETSNVRTEEIGYGYDKKMIVYEEEKTKKTKKKKYKRGRHSLRCA